MTGRRTVPAGDRPADRPVLHHPSTQHGAQQLQDALVTDAFGDRLYQPGMRNRLETIGDVRLNHPTPSAPCLVDEDLQRVVRAAPGTKPERARQHVGLKDRLGHQLHRGLHDPVRHSGDRQRPLLGRAGLGDEHPTRRLRLVAAVLETGGELVEQPVNPVPLDLLDGHLVDAWCATIAAHQLPRALQHVPAVDLVIERVEPSPGVGLGRPVQRVLQGTDRIQHLRSQNGGTSHLGTHRASPCQAARIDEAAALPLPAVVLSARLNRYYGRLRRPPGQHPLPDVNRL